MTDLDRQATEAVDILARRIRERDAAVRAGDADLPDADVFAREFVLAMLGHGWRVTEAKVHPAWRVPRRPGSGLPAGEEAAKLVRQARADAAAASAQLHARDRNEPKEAV
jgi:hypothetical protein